MANLIHQLKSYWNYKRKAVNRHGIHSPFVYDLYCNTVKNKDYPSFYNEIEEQRLELLLNDTELDTNDLGSGSKILPNTKRKVSKIAKHFLQNRREAQFLHKLVNHLKPRIILELGTSLGVTTLYLSSVDGTEVTSVEGCSATLGVATRNFDRAKRKNITTLNGNIDELLKPTLKSLKFVDFVIIDANHDYEPTLRYFEMIMPHLKNESCVIIDDIYQKPGMTKAWEEITSKEGVNVALDFYRFGIVFPRVEQRKQHFVLRF